MATDNVHKYGFRWAAGQGPMPAPVKLFVATGQDHVDDGATSVILRPGDPLKLVSTGGVNLAVTTNLPSYIMVGLGPVWDGTAMSPRRTFPNQNAWGTVEARRPYVLGVPVKSGYWEIDVDDATSATTYAGYVAFIGENAEHTCAGSATIDPVGRVGDPRLDISVHATTAGLGWRIEGISESVENRDFAGANVKLIVRVNDSQEAGSAATNVVGI